MKQLQKKVRVKLDRGNLVTFGVLLTCKCGKKNWVTHKDSRPEDIWYCDGCDWPIVAIGEDGKMYLIRERIIERGVDDVNGG